MVRPGRAARATLTLLLLSSAMPAAGAVPCDDILPASNHSERGTRRPVTAQELVQLRDIGLPDGALSGPSALAVSPDGGAVAYLIRKADPVRNSYCQALVTMPTKSGSTPRILDRGGDLVTLKAFVRGLLVDTGLPSVITPSWSPDGQWLAWLRRDQGVTQAWIVRADGSGARVVTASTVDIERIGWSRDSRRLLVSSRPGTSDATERIDREGQGGWLYDDRVATNAGVRPRIRERDVPPVLQAVDLQSGLVAKASTMDQANFDRSQDNAPVAIASTGQKAWAAADGDSILAQQRLWASNASGRKVRCDAEQCLGVEQYWWDRGGQSLFFLRREGWNREESALYRWRPAELPPVRIFTTTDALQNCAPALDRLICSAENATTPRRLLLVDPSGGTRQLLFDPNPEFAKIALGTVKRLRFRNSEGLESWADLVLPAGHRSGSKLPMIIVQYNSRGFLRGGTGDEYPIHLFAANGYAVLSFQRPPSIAAAKPRIRTEVAANAANLTDWADRRSVLSSLLAGVRLAVATGDVDETRIGITGLSDGATTVRFALINSKAFAAAAISSCCLEPKTVMTYGGMAWATFNRALGYPNATTNAPEFWRPMSLAINAEAIDTPLLMQLSDDESLLSLEALTALQEHGKPVELHVFPDEHHVKWQPAHRLAIYQRGLDWFDFWLRCSERNDPAAKAQYERWKAMRARSQTNVKRCTEATPR